MRRTTIYRLVFPMGLFGLLQACTPCPDPVTPPTDGNNANCGWQEGLIQSDSSRRVLLVCEFEGRRIWSDTSGVGEG